MNPLQQCQDSATNNEEDASASFAPRHVTLEALENTKVAVAQFAATALANGADEASLKELAMLQNTLYTLQHQQVFQIQLIQQLQSQVTSGLTGTAKDLTKKPIKNEQNSEIEPTKQLLMEPIKDDVDKIQTIHHSSISQKDLCAEVTLHPR